MPVVSRIKNIFFCICVFLSFVAKAQTDVSVMLDGMVLGNNRRLSSVYIMVYKGSAVLDSLRTGNDGRFRIFLPLQNDYTIWFSKADFKNKYILVSTRSTTPIAKTIRHSTVIALEESEWDDNGNPIPYTPTQAASSLAFDPSGKIFDILDYKGQTQASIDSARTQRANALTNVEKTVTDLPESDQRRIQQQLADIDANIKQMMQLAADEANQTTTFARLLATEMLASALTDSARIVTNTFNMLEAPSAAELQILSMEASGDWTNDSLNNLNHGDTLSVQERMLLVRQRFIEQAKTKLEVDRLNAKTNEDSVKIAQRELLIANIEQQMNEARSEIENARRLVELQQAQIKNQRFIMLSALLVLVLIAAILILVYRNARKRQKLNLLLEKQNRELERLSIVARETDNAVIITDSKGNFEWVNESFTRMFGYNIQQLIGEKGASIMGKDTQSTVNQKINESITQKKSVQYEMQTLRSTGESLWVHATVSPVLDKSGNLQQLVVVDSDISRIKEAEQRLKVQNENIQASIRYALTIQQALLPRFADIQKHHEGFLIFLPRDIVSGDFYWFHHQPQHNRSIIAAIDCTGHGVPGAFMSLIANSIFNQIVIERGITSPGKILTLLHDEVRNILSQDQTHNNDGMDVCLCTIEKNNDLVENTDKKVITEKINVIFAGAKRPLYYISSNDAKVQNMRGDLRSIGGKSRRRTQVEEDFSDTVLQLEQGSMLYLSSDGLTDQASETRKKFGNDTFMNLLAQIWTKPAAEQKTFIEKQLAQHQGSADQRDDITLIGIRL